MCSCVLLLVVCDRAPTQPVSPIRPTPAVTAEPAAEEPVHEASVVRVEAQPEPEVPDVPDAIAEPTMEDQTPADPSRDSIETPEPSKTTSECCRTCRKGKACGDTCVARDRECTVAPGCACDA
jgi:hypothetical protein